MIHWVLTFASSTIQVGGFAWTGTFTTSDLISAATNPLNGACAGIAFVFGYVFGVIVVPGLEERLAKEPAGVYLHDDGRPRRGAR